MEIHDRTRDGETEAGAAGFARAGLIGAVEPLEDVGQIFVADANSGVANLDSRVPCSIREVHLNFAAGRRVLDGVFDENQEETLDLGRIGGTRYPARSNVSFYFPPLSLRPNAGLVGNLLQIRHD